MWEIGQAKRNQNIGPQLDSSHKELSDCAYKDLVSHGFVCLPILSPGCHAVTVRHVKKGSCVMMLGQTLGAEHVVISFSVCPQHETVF